MSRFRTGASLRRGWPERIAATVGIGTLALGVGVLATVHPSAAAAASALLALLAVLLFSAQSLKPKPQLVSKSFRWVVFAWVYVLIRPIGHFTTGRSTLTAVAGVPSAENVLDLGIHAAIAALALWSLRRNRFSLRASWLILALPALALSSAAWSLAPNVTLGFSFELVAIYLLAVLTASILSVDGELGRSILRRTLRAAVLLVALLALIGLAFPHSADSAALATPGDNRFTWPGEHPLVATAELGFALLITVFAARAELGLRRSVRIALALLFGVCLYLGQSRTAFAGLIVASLFGAWFVSRGSSWPRRLAGAGAILTGLLIVASSFGGPITSYLYRGQSEQQVSGLNGRLGLWTFALDRLHSPVHWLFGYGLSSTRVFLAGSVQWAGDAHGAWIELLLSLGLVGIAVAVILVATLAVRLIQAGRSRPLASRVIAILFVYVLAMSPAATGFAAPGPEPGLGFAVLALCYVATAVRQPARSEVLGRRGINVGGELSPAPT